MILTLGIFLAIKFAPEEFSKLKNALAFCITVILVLVIHLHLGVYSISIISSFILFFDISALVVASLLMSVDSYDKDPPDVYDIESQEIYIKID